MTLDIDGTSRPAGHQGRRTIVWSSAVFPGRELARIAEDDADRATTRTRELPVDHKWSTGSRRRAGDAPVSREHDAADPFGGITHDVEHETDSAGTAPSTAIGADGGALTREYAKTPDSRNCPASPSHSTIRSKERRITNKHYLNLIRRYLRAAPAVLKRQAVPPAHPARDRPPRRILCPVNRPARSRTCQGAACRAGEDLYDAIRDVPRESFDRALYPARVPTARTWTVVYRSACVSL